MITQEDYFGRVSHLEAPSQEITENAVELLERVNALLADCVPIEAAVAPKVNSGWRPVAYNAQLIAEGKPASKKSRHITGQAIDLDDDDGELDEYLIDNPQILARHGLWMEHPLATKGWCHLQCVPPRSGNRVFYP